jgi:N-acetylglucosaminyl-diphospho-decaprenol L-rhamnosyltransferase
MTASIVIVSFNTVDYLRECLTAVYAQVNPMPEVIVVDNASHDGSVAMIKKEFPQAICIESNKNLGFGVANNLAVERASQPYVVLLNSDAILKTDTVSQLVNYLASHPEVSCVMPRVVLPHTGLVQPKTFGFSPTIKHILMQSLGLNRVFPNARFFRGTDGDYRWAKEMQVDWVSGVCMAMRRQDYLAVGGFDARFFMYCEDLDLCIRLSKLGKIMVYDDFDVMHYGGASSKTISAKVRNSVLQQQHLLMIVSQYHGTGQAWMARLLLSVGLLMRLSVGLVKVPSLGFSENETLQSTLARLKHLCGFNRHQQEAS